MVLHLLLVFVEQIYSIHLENLRQNLKHGNSKCEIQVSKDVLL